MPLDDGQCVRQCLATPRTAVEDDVAAVEDTAVALRLARQEATEAHLLQRLCRCGGHQRCLLRRLLLISVFLWFGVLWPFKCVLLLQALKREIDGLVSVEHDGSRLLHFAALSTRRALPVVEVHG
ncbi:hypothetical protein DQ04_02021010 [Trypanosoma grayi]|uniref:hypothetical protein n=1 Tax=Trypanosoma grayi TaxID=71804 RepID=UPI0004F4251B|nr:hypothetical protein DQ04_02021010 [Trypanosoma grayi]KEG12075.1 hypothetical protein DQ04_02021010 [Trypanosoma grayi]